MKFSEKEASPAHGRQFNTTKISEATVTEIMSAVQNQGAATIIKVHETEDSTSKVEEFKSEFESKI